jgi:hypothetical protein
MFVSPDVDPDPDVCVSAEEASVVAASVVGEPVTSVPEEGSVAVPPVVASPDVLAPLVATSDVLASSAAHAASNIVAPVRKRFDNDPTRRSTRFLVIVTDLLASAIVACSGTSGDAGAVTATDTQPHEDGSSTGSSTGTGDAAAPCGAGICAAPPPEGWFGPLVRFDNDGTKTPPACGGGWPDAAFTLLGGYVDPGPAQCSECTCSVDVDVLCTLAGYRTEGSEVCDYRDAFQLPTPDTCDEVVVDDGSLWLYAFTDALPPCIAEFTAEIPEVAWTLEVTGCRGAEPGDACDDAGRQCLAEVPDGFSNHLCIFANGDLSCPPGDYIDKTVLYSGADDNRTCGTCMCGNATGTCTGEFEIFDSEDCSGDPLDSRPANGGCTGAVAGVRSLRFDYDGPTACDVFQPPASAGSVAPAGEITYCCLPDAS